MDATPTVLEEDAVYGFRALFGMLHEEQSCSEKYHSVSMLSLVTTCKSTEQAVMPVNANQLYRRELHWQCCMLELS